MKRKRMVRLWKKVDNEPFLENPTLMVYNSPKRKKSRSTKVMAARKKVRRRRKRSTTPAANPVPHRRRYAMSHRRRRRSNPFPNSPVRHRRHHRRARHNPPELGGLNMGTIQNVGIATVGFFGPPLLKQMVPMLTFGNERYSWTDIATDVAYGIGAGFLASKFLSRRVGNWIYIGTGMLLAFDLVVKFFGPQVGMSMKGMGSSASSLGYSYYYPSPISPGAGYPYVPYFGYRPSGTKLLSPQRGIQAGSPVSHVIPLRSTLRI